MTRTVTTLSVRVAVTLALAGAAAPGLAAEWRFAPVANAAVEYLGNPRLRPDRHDEAYASYRYEVTVPMSVDDGRTQFSFTPRYQFARFPEDRLRDRDDASASLGAVRRYESALFSASADFVRDSTLTSELGLTGLTETDRTHEALSVGIQPVAELSDRTQLGWRLAAMNHRYLDAGGTGLVDYQYHSLGANLDRALTEQLHVGLQTSYGVLVAPDAFTRTAYTTLGAALDWRLSALWRMSLSFAPTHVAADRERSDSYVYSASLGRQGSRGGLDFSVGREVSPTGRGTLVTRDQASVSVHYALTERLGTTLAVRGIRTTDALPAANGMRETIDYGSADASLSYRFAERWSVDISVGGRALDYDTRRVRADGYVATVALIWQGGARALAR